MLDDLKYIHRHDPQDAFGLAEKQWQQLEHTFEVPDVPMPKQVVFAGMGGSALAALLSVTWPGYRLPFEVVRDYQLPPYIDSHTLVIICSYSGNTEETLACLEEARAKNASIVVIASGGQLEQQAVENDEVFIKLPQANQPRYAVFYALKALVTLLEKADLVDESDAESQLHQAAGFLQTAAAGWAPTVPSANNPAKQLAKELAGKTPVIYAGKMLAPAAYKWKISFNENAKNVAWWGVYPEFNHNEFLGWSSHPVDKPYEVIDLRSSLEDPRVRRRFEISDRLLSGRRPKAHVVEAQGTSALQQLLWAVVYGDFVSLYLAMLNGVNPTPVDLIERLKVELAKPSSTQKP